MSIRSYCLHCNQWVDVCQEAFGFKFVKLGRGDDGDYGVMKHLDETPFEMDDTGDIYKCGSCYHEILQHAYIDASVFTPREWVIVGDTPEGWRKVPLVPYTDWDDKANFVALTDLEGDFPHGLPCPKDAEFCYDTEDLTPVIEPHKKKDEPDEAI